MPKPGPPPPLSRRRHGRSGHRRRASAGRDRHLVGLVEFLELGLGRLVARVAVGVVLHGELAEGAVFSSASVAVAADAEELVVVALGHSMPVDAVDSARPAWPGRTRPCGLRRSVSPRHCRQRDGRVSSGRCVHGECSSVGSGRFFLSSSPTSSKSASTTSSFLASSPASPAVARRASACWALYIASPSFIEACISSFGPRLDGLDVLAVERGLAGRRSRPRSRALSAAADLVAVFRQRLLGRVDQRSRPGSWPRPARGASCPRRRAPRRP